MNSFKATMHFTWRNIKTFFKDKGMLISAFISPLVILLLYILFLHNVLYSSFEGNLPVGFELDEKLMSGYVAAYEVSSILAVCCVTVAFVANMAMVEDRVSGVRADLMVTPAKGHVFVFGYYLATAAVTLVICYITMLVGFAYIAAMGWSLTVGDVFATMLDVLLSVLFGTAFSSVVCYFLKSRGAITAVCTIVSTVYGFISGAYYPISQFSAGMANTVMCLPGTYCTGLLRSHIMGGYSAGFENAGMPADAVDGIMRALDGKMSFWSNDVPVWAMYLVVCGAILALVGIFIVLNVVKIKKSKRTEKKSNNE